VRPLSREIDYRVRREQEKLDRVSSEIRCVIYKGYLPDGSLSQGFIPVYGSGLYGAAWVVPVSEVDKTEYRGTIDTSLPTDSPGAQSEWAKSHVRVVKVEFKGVVFMPDHKEWDVIVPGPFHNATHGRLVRKPGASVEVGVPDGDTQADINRRSIVDRSVSVSNRMETFKSTYMTPDKGLRGLQGELNEVKVPRPNDIWIGN